MGNVSHKDLEVWKKSVSLVTEVYQATSLFPKEEIYAITSQIRRSAVSIPSNIAEGAARQTNKEFIRFLFIASGSCAELDTQMLIAHQLQYLDEDTYKELCPKVEEVGKMINGLIKYRRTIV